MPSKNVITPLEGGKYFHLFNRGINRNPIFFQPENYHYFLILWKKYLSNYLEVLAYCLLPNHFHFLIRLKENIELEMDGNTQKVIDKTRIGKVVSENIRRVFISYSQAINRQENRTGGLFTRNYKRIEILEDDHLRYLFFYIHTNPEKHGISNNYTSYKYSSFEAYLKNAKTNVSKEHGLKLFDGIESFKDYHSYFHQERMNLILE